jgi:hypothetical protein
MTSRSPLIALLILLLFPAAGHAADPLLSGYAGPGGGEQVVLGGGTVGGGGGTSGGSRAAATTADESLRAPASSSAVAPGTPSKLTEKPQKRKTPLSAASQPKTMPSSATTATTNKTAPAGAPQTVAYPTRAGAVSGLPISAGGVLALAAAIALFVLAALGLRRLSVGSEDAPRGPQVSSS